MAMLIDTTGLEKISIPEEAPAYRRKQLILKRDEYLSRIPTAKSREAKYHLFGVIALNDVIEQGVAEAHEVVRKWRKAYPQDGLSEIAEAWEVLFEYANNGGQGLRNQGKCLDQLYPNGKER